MAIPGLHQVVEAVERIASSVAGVGTSETGVTTSERVRTDGLRVVYRLVFADLATRRGGLVDPGDAVALLDLEVVRTELVSDMVEELVSTLAVAGSPLEALEPVTALGALHESVLARGSARKAAGAYFTPPTLVEWLTGHTVGAALDHLGDPAQLTVLDPSCGAGVFLVAATRKLIERGIAPARALRQVAGVDRDAGALEIARVCLWLEAVEPDRPVSMPELALHQADALLDNGWEASSPPDGFHVVVGNPPFLNQLERLTAHRPGVAARLSQRSHHVLRPYTDVSAVFLQRSVDWVRAGGQVGLVQPQSLLAARDAAGVRAYVADSCALEALWASDVPVFDAKVLTCAPVLRKNAPQKAVRRFHGPAFEELEPRREAELAGGWAFLLAAGLGIPEVVLPRSHGVVADLAECTADFRDQYYGLAPYVLEAATASSAHVAPLVTSGLIDPAQTLWGQRPTRFLKRSWDAPVIDLEALQADPKLDRWATRRLVPKVLVGTQGRVIEAVVDEDGGWLPSVPTITVTPASDILWHALAVLLAPPVSAHAAVLFAGTALSMRAIKLSASQVGQLPLPPRSDSWDRGAEAVRRAQHEPSLRKQHLADAGRHMCTAYGVGDATYSWWLGRLQPLCESWTSL